PLHSFPTRRSSDLLEIHAHAGESMALIVVGDAARQADFLKGSVTLVPKKLLRKRIVGNQDVGPAIPVKIVERNSESFTGRTANSRRLRNVGEGAVPLVSI